MFYVNTNLPLDLKPHIYFTSNRFEYQKSFQEYNVVKSPLLSGISYISVSLYLLEEIDFEAVDVNGFQYKHCFNQHNVLIFFTLLL